MSFGAVVHKRLLEPRMLQGLFGSYTLLGIVNKYLPQEIEELAVEVGVTWNGFLRLLVVTRH
jgi:hypothetical protein